MPSPELESFQTAREYEWKRLVIMRHGKYPAAEIERQRVRYDAIVAVVDAIAAYDALFPAT